MAQSTPAAERQVDFGCVVIVAQIAEANRQHAAEDVRFLLQFRLFDLLLLGRAGGRCFLLPAKLGQIVNGLLGRGDYSTL